MNNIKNLVLLSVLLSFFLSCNKKSNYTSLPDKSQEGRLTFGFLENGEVRATSGMMKSGFTNDGLGVKYELTNADSMVQINAQNTKQNWYIMMQMTKPTPGTYVLDGIDGSLVLSKNWGTMTDPQLTVYETKSGNKVTVVVTKYNGDILAGHLQGKVINANGDIINIQDGRFDIKKY